MKLRIRISLLLRYYQIIDLKQLFHLFKVLQKFRVISLISLAEESKLRLLHLHFPSLVISGEESSQMLKIEFSSVLEEIMKTTIVDRIFV